MTSAIAVFYKDSLTDGALSQYDSKRSAKLTRRPRHGKVPQSDVTRGLIGRASPIERADDLIEWINTSERKGSLSFAFRLGMRRQDVEGLPAIQPIDLEVPPIRGENARRIEFLRERHERSIGEIHGLVCVLLNERVDSLQRLRARWHQHGAPRQKELDARGNAVVHTSHEMRRFRQHGLGRHDRSGPGLEHAQARGVLRLIPIEQRHQRARVEQQFTGHA
jgi:hypothetical protein